MSVITFRTSKPRKATCSAPLLRPPNISGRYRKGSTIASQKAAARTDQASPDRRGTRTSREVGVETDVRGRFMSRHHTLDLIDQYSPASVRSFQNCSFDVNHRLKQPPGVSSISFFWSVPSEAESYPDAREPPMETNPYRHTLAVHTGLASLLRVELREGGLEKDAPRYCGIGSRRK